MSHKPIRLFVSIQTVLSLTFPLEDCGKAVEISTRSVSQKHNHGVSQILYSNQEVHQNYSQVVLKKEEEKLDLKVPSAARPLKRGRQSGLFLMKLLLTVQVRAEWRMSLQPIDNQISDTNPQQPNSCHPSLMYVPPLAALQDTQHPTLAPPSAPSLLIGQSGRRSN